MIRQKFFSSIRFAVLLVGLMVFAEPFVYAQVNVPPSSHPPVAAPAAAPPQIAPTIIGMAPVAGDQVFSAGTVGGQALTWVVAAFGTTIGTALTAWLYRLFQIAGIKFSEAAKAQLQSIIVNGLNAGAAAVSQNLQGKGKVEVKNEVVAKAVTYTQEHGADLIKQMGLDPQSGEAVQAIRARIETAIADPMAPTPEIVDPTPTPMLPADAPRQS